MQTRPTLLFVSLFACACGSSESNVDGGSSDSFDRAALLSSVATLVAENASSLEAASVVLAEKTSAYCTAIGGEGEAAAETEVKTAWSEAMVFTQRSEVLRIGPAAENNNALRDSLYSWPQISSCAVDQEVEAYRQNPGGYDISGRLTNRRGMDALEYVLFSESLDHTCASPVAPEGWNELPELERKQARCGYATLAADDVQATSASIALGWSPSGGDFGATLAGAGESGNPFGSPQEALNVVSDSLFFVEFEVKDIKLGESAGITENSCGVIGEACLEELESPFADHTQKNILANVQAFEELFLGGTGVGFDDMLIELGASQLAQTMSADIAAMVTAAEAIGPSMRTSLTADYQAVAASHAAVKVVTDNLKSQFLTVLGLDIPDNSAGDND